LLYPDAFNLDDPILSSLPQLEQALYARAADVDAQGLGQSAKLLPFPAACYESRLVLTIDYIKIINFTNHYPLRTMDTSDETSLCYY
jgi:hypothetical protein